MQNSARNVDGALLGVAALFFAIGAALLHTPQGRTPMLILRWLAILALCLWAARRRKLI